MNRLLGWALASGLVFLVGCKTSYVAAPAAVSFTAVDSLASEDPTVVAAIAPYKSSLDAKMNEVVGRSARELYKSNPEGLLNNFVADIFLQHGRQKVDPALDFAIVNSGGLRVPLPAGDITLGRIYELMPFDNRVVVLTLAPAQMQELFAHVAKGSEVCFAGVRMTVENGETKAVTIGGKPYDPTRSYRLATIDYLADGGSNMTFLKTRTDYVDTGLFARDFIADYLRQELAAGRVVDAKLDGRLEILGTGQQH